MQIGFRGTLLAATAVYWLAYLAWRPTVRET
jgi:hypothetical protein